jgi:hypothetical protein
MFSLSAPLGRMPFAFGVSIANTVILLAALASFAFLPAGAGHAAVLIIMGALMWWWFTLHARRFAATGRGAAWPALMAAAAFLTFAVSYIVIAALWSVPEVQEAAFRTGGSDYRHHKETLEALATLGRWMASGVGAASAIVTSGLLAMLMGLVSLAAGLFSLVTLMLPAAASAPMPRAAPRLN